MEELADLSKDVAGVAISSPIVWPDRLIAIGDDHGHDDAHFSA
ncbi:hypothetical protein HOE425_331813 [Hoeflea sp. EC-HK425]|nr:hypothetical protein HOE425_331813 [Hoeflea sp. EC-HK425]